MLRQVIEYLLRGSDPSLENRLTALIQGRFLFSIPGFKEALLTKALCVAFPDRFMTIVTYDQKRAMAKAVCGLDLPDRAAEAADALIPRASRDQSVTSPPSETEEALPDQDRKEPST